MIISGSRRGRLAAAAAALAVVAVAGCSSSKSGTGPSDTAAAGSTPTTTAPSGTAPSTTAPSTTAPSADAATVAAIKNAYAKFFAPDTPEQVSLGLLQNGAAFKATIERQGQGSYAQKSSAKVTEVSLASADVAKVVYTIYVGDQPMLPNQPGYAVRENGTWKVAEHTFCQLLTLENSAPAECQTPTGMNPPK